MKSLFIEILNYLRLKSFVKKMYSKFNFTSSLDVNGKIYKIPHIYGSSLQINEKWMIEILKRLFKLRSGAFLDVGVNLGQTLIEVKSLDEKRYYIGFEPNPACVFYAEELKRINNLSVCDIIAIGLYTSDTILQLDLYDDNITNSGGSIIKDYWEYKKYRVKRNLLVPVFSFSTIDAIMNYPKFDIIKIDVEGAELEVFETLYNLIVKDKPFIIVEILSAYSVENKLRYTRQIKIEDILNKLNYNILRIVENETSSIRRLEKITGFDVNANPNDCNYLLYHQNDESLIVTTFGPLIS